MPGPGLVLREIHRIRRHAKDLADKIEQAPRRLKAQQNQLAFANTAYQHQMSALQGLSGLYGVDSNLLGKTLGIPSQLLNVRANAGRSGQGFFTSLGSGLGSTLGALPSTLF